MNTKILLAALSQDLYRVATGYNNGSINMAKRFSEEALKTKDTVDIRSVKPYIQKILQDLPGVLSQENKKHLAEDALAYSILLQNAAIAS